MSSCFQGKNFPNWVISLHVKCRVFRCFQSSLEKHSVSRSSYTYVLYHLCEDLENEQSHRHKMIVTIPYGYRIRYCLKGASKCLSHMLPGIILKAALEFVVLVNDVRILGQSFIPNLQAWRLVENQALVRPCPVWLCFMITNSKTLQRAVVPGLSSSHSFTHTILVVWQSRVLVTL